MRSLESKLPVCSGDSFGVCETHQAESAWSPGLGYGVEEWHSRDSVYVSQSNVFGTQDIKRVEQEEDICGLKKMEAFSYL